MSETTEPRPARAAEGTPSPTEREPRRSTDVARSGSSDVATQEKPRKRVKSERAKAETRLGWMLAGPAFVLMLLVTVYPILQAVFDSLFSFRLTAPDDREFVGLANYGVILTDGVFWYDLGITLLITVITVAVELVLGFALALVMNNAIRSLRGPLRTAILVPYGTITVVSAFAWFYAFDINTGYINSWFSWLPFISEDTAWFGSTAPALFVIMASEIWKTTPFISLLLLSGLAQVPGELTEAAKVDGATWWERMSKVILPNMKAAIMVAVLFRALDAFRIFDNIFIMTNGAYGTETLSLLAYRTSIGRLEIGMGSAVSVVLFLCVILISFIAIKGFKVDLAGRGGGK
ncbi:sugar ABC transporter permease [Ammonicoccus fulvus]|uniref:Sugar ABC transporter permease n=1 Tax=Ammonicoccus fulvus TaxID=3138240 RepID=A0ABZ3FRU3_9ACTN